MATIIDLERERNARLDRLIRADEATGVCLTCDWQTALLNHADPTSAHMIALASAIDDALEADDYQDMRERLLSMAAAARDVAVERARRTRP